MRLLLFVILIPLFLVSCQNNQSTMTVDMYNASGDMVGTANLNEHPEGVEIKVKMKGLSPGYHGIHVHEYPKCDAPDFKSAGNHYNPEGKEHGLMNPDGAHVGDLPNVEADGDGLVETEVMLTGATMLDGKNSIVQKGTSIIVDQDKDDGMSQPSGNPGKRIICGQIKANADKGKEESPTDPTETEKEEEE